MSEKLAAAVAVEIKRLCEDRGWSGRELARRTGLVASVIAYKLSGERPFDLDDVAAVAAAMDMTAARLIGLAEAQGV